MIVGLLGNDSQLVTALQEHLNKKGFYPCRLDELSVLEKAQHYVVREREVPLNCDGLQEQGMILVWVGPRSKASASFDLVLGPQDSEKEARTKINQLVWQRLAGPTRPDWDEYFMKIAQVASMRSNCIKRRVGALIVRDRRIISTGYNGTPRGTRNCNEGGCPRCSMLAASGTRLEECLCSHAEENAITQAAYHGTSVKDGMLYTTFSPCLMCTKMVINSGIIEVIFNVEYPLNDISFELLDQASVTIRKHQAI